MHESKVGDIVWWFISWEEGLLRAFCCGDPAKIGEPTPIETLSIKEYMIESCKLWNDKVLTFGHVDEILRCES